VQGGAERFAVSFWTCIYGVDVGRIGVLEEVVDEVGITVGYGDVEAVAGVVAEVEDHGGEAGRVEVLGHGGMGFGRDLRGDVNKK
jgi:hypothetical protein